MLACWLDSSESSWVKMLPNRILRSKYFISPTIINSKYSIHYLNRRTPNEVKMCSEWGLFRTALQKSSVTAWARLKPTNKNLRVLSCVHFALHHLKILTRTFCSFQLVCSANTSGQWRWTFVFSVPIVLGRKVGQDELQARFIPAHWITAHTDNHTHTHTRG